MPDQLEEMFAELRTQTVPQVRPPGAEAARRTVRQRRARTRTTVLAGAVLVMIAGAAIGVGRSQLLGDPAGPSAKELNRMATQARKVVEQDVQQPSVLADQGPVRANYTRTHAVQAGSFLFDASCIGSGELTFVISRTPVDEQDYNVELVEVNVPCLADPEVSAEPFRVRGHTDLVITVKYATGASRAGFAYRVMSGIGPPLPAGK
jgi:outer membrane lipoprotein SlyB